MDSTEQGIKVRRYHCSDRYKNSCQLEVKVLGVSYLLYATLSFAQRSSLSLTQRSLGGDTWDQLSTLTSPPLVPFALSDFTETFYATILSASYPTNKDFLKPRPLFCQIQGRSYLATSTQPSLSLSSGKWLHGHNRDTAPVPGHYPTWLLKRYEWCIDCGCPGNKNSLADEMECL